MSTKNLTEGSIMGNVASFAVPYMAAYFLQILYGLADLFIVGQYCDVDSTTAVSNAAQVMYMLTVVVIGLAMGTTVRIGRAVGARDERQVAHIIGSTFVLFLLLSVILCFVLFLLRSQIVTLINTPVEAVEEATDYLAITFIGIPFIVCYNIIASIFRGMGDSRTPMFLIGLTCVENILLDYFFIGFLGMGAMGAAMGTTISQMCSVLISVLVIRKHRSIMKVSKNDFCWDSQTISEILKIGVPVAMQDGFIQVAFLTITVIANSRGLYDAAAVGIVEKSIGLIFIIPSAMLSTVSTISAQNIGAKQMKRAKTTMKYALYITMTYGVLIGIVLQFVPETLVRLFTNNEHVIHAGGEYLRGYAWDAALAGMHFCFSGFFTALGLSIISFSHNIASIILVRIPLSYWTCIAYPTTLYPMGLAIPAGSLLSVLICMIVYWRLFKNGRFVVEKS